MSKLLKGVTAAFVALILASIVLLLVFLISYCSAGSAMPKNARLTLCQQEDGSLLLQWPEADKADRYIVEFFLYPSLDQPDESLVVSENSCILPGLPAQARLSIRVTSQRDYNFLWLTRERNGNSPLEADCTLSPPEVSELHFRVSPEDKTAALGWDGGKDDVFRLYLQAEDGSLTLFRTLNESAAEISFAPGGDLEMPEYGQEYVFVLDAYRESDGLVFYGLPSAGFSIKRDDLLGTELELECVDLGYNSYTLSWNEVKGDSYELQLLDDNGQWLTVREYDKTEELTYSTGRLVPFTSYQLRVVARGEETLPGSEFSADPAYITLSTRESILYAGIWPLKDLELYAGTDRQQVIGTVAAATPLCVLEEADGLFYVRTDDGCGYIDSTYCLIDLTDYLGELCSYDITNSYSSLYMVHEYAIPEVTDTVVQGYEYVALEDGSYLVPLIYPAAQKLMNAALAAREDGYRLKIYDAFRPLQATRSIYDLTSLILSDPIPEETFTGKDVEEDLALLSKDRELTYQLLMTNGIYSLGHFLAERGSYHNIGIALDLTLERLSNGEELEMQSSLHDLSWYSVLSRNNENADLLNQYMTGAGFNELSSEWWHFQDDESRLAYGINSFMWSGVSPEGWRADDGGWKYRRSDGTYYTSVTVSISGTSYTFDENGYATEAE